MRRTFLTPGQLFIKSLTRPIQLHLIVESTLRLTSHFALCFFTTFARKGIDK